MNLGKKKTLAAKALKIGRNRVIFNKEGLGEIKEAITKQDIIGLHQEGIISVKPIKGRKKIVRRKSPRGPGKIKKTVNKRKQIYVKITRKLRGYLKELKARKIIDRELFLDLRKKIRMRYFRSKAHLKTYLKGVEVDFDVKDEVSGKVKDFKKVKKASIKKVEKESKVDEVKK